jgi:hypothetical protein
MAQSGDEAIPAGQRVGGNAFSERATGFNITTVLKKEIVTDPEETLVLNHHFRGTSGTRSSSSLVTDCAAGTTAFASTEPYVIRGCDEPVQIVSLHNTTLGNSNRGAIVLVVATPCVLPRRR